MRYALSGLIKTNYTLGYRDPVSKLKNANDEEKQIIIRNTFNFISNKIKDWLHEK